MIAYGLADVSQKTSLREDKSYIYGIMRNTFKWV